MLTYMADGGFIDNKTEAVDVEFVTFSPTLNRLSLAVFSFRWQVCGTVRGRVPLLSPHTRKPPLSRTYPSPSALPTTTPPHAGPESLLPRSPCCLLC